jgi:hypothetical protein
MNMSDDDKLRVAATAAADAIAIKERLADQLGARRAARLADPNAAPLWRTLYGVQQRTRRRKPTLARVAKQAVRAGVEVAGYEVRPDGTIGVVIGKPVGNVTDTDDTTTIDRSEFH